MADNTATGDHSPGAGGRRRGVLPLIWAYARLNLSMAMEYRASFLSQAFGMFVNDGLWLVFWALYFARFPVVRGWQEQDVFMLWAVVTLGFGMVMGLFGNALRLAYLVMQGQLDYYLAMPQDVLIHTLLGRMYFTAWGDALFGIFVFLAFGHPTPARLIVFVLVSVLSGLIMVSFAVLAHSLAFFLGGSQALSDQVMNALIHFSTYPTSLFHGVTKFILYTAIPAAFVSGLPVMIMRDFSWQSLAVLAAVALAGVALAYRVFYAGLRRYESGNLVNLQG